MGAHQYPLRIPPELHDRLRRLAGRQGVSLNTMILMLLASSVGFSFDSQEEPAMTDTDKARALHWLNERVGHLVTRIELQRDERGGEKSLGLIEGRLILPPGEQAHVIVAGTAPHEERVSMWVDPDATVSEEKRGLRIQLGARAHYIETND